MVNTDTPFIIKVDDISFDYGNSVNALQDISLEIKQGEQVALVGHNGSGKSTLAKHLNGLLKQTSGSVLINGESTEIKRTAQLAGTVALLFQNPDDQICKRTVRDEVAFGPRNLGYSKDRIQELVYNALSDFDLLSFEEFNPHDLGYSQRKRLALASVCAMDTPVIIMDEPTAGLDPHEVSILKSVMDKLKAMDRTVIVISHDMDFLAETAARAVCLNEGKKIYDGCILDFFSRQTMLEDCGLLCPQIARLCAYFNLRPQRYTPDDFITELEKTRR
ncbi:ABC transporter ATP-binding protein [Maridesulfovibrio sp.]|uniref:energy-coupling factor ABC transporter ATP-binding protein n=1 Tax=Maridesulfovibrio sp. TaxID=2795000 RepID=UPI002A18719E|nr:ABC transporter ATP-binding protein [Maridesulfovibrio sp.]